MKRIKTIYWIATLLFAVFMACTAVPDVLMSPDAVKFIKLLGYPDYFVPFIGVAKILGAIAIVIPGYYRVKEWAYAGLFFVMTGAFLSHLLSGDHSVKGLIGPLFQTVFIILSWYLRPANRRIIAVNS